MKFDWPDREKSEINNRERFDRQDVIGTLPALLSIPPDEEYRWFLVRGVPLRDPHGKIVKWYGTLADIESGLELAISHSIVESHGSRLWATSNNKRRAAFYFTLPTHVTESALVV